MLIENRTARILVVSLLVLFLIPLVVALGMMTFGAGIMGGMMTGMQMGGMHMTAGFWVVCLLWTLLVAAALIGLIVLLTRGTDVTRHREVPSPNMRSPLPH